MATPDYYEILGVSLAAGQDEIKAAFRHLARERHPDQNPDGPYATANFQLLNQAYDTLTDTIERLRYDHQYPPQPTRQEQAGGTRGQTTTSYPLCQAETDNSALWIQLRQHIAKSRAKRTTLYAQSRSLQNELAATETKLAQAIVRLRILQEEEAARKKNSRSWLAFFWRPIAAQQEEQSREAIGHRTGMPVLEAQLEELTSTREKQREVLAQLKYELRFEKELAGNALKTADRAAAKQRQDQARERAANERERQAQEEKAAEQEGGWPYYPEIAKEQEEIMERIWREQDEQEQQDEIDSWY